jgi:hypothetical protein
MVTIKRYFSGVAIFISAMILYSCNTDDFDFSKLASPDDITPYISAPLAYGTFKVDDLNPGTYVPATPIPVAGLNLDSVMLNKTGISFRSSAIDTIYLITRLTNNTAAVIEYSICFVDRSTGNQIGAGSIPAMVPPGAIDQEIKFTLGPADQDNLQIATDLKLSFKLLPPATGNITYNVVRSKSISVKISFYAPVNLWRLIN